ncbi:MAG: tyrosine-type recombinase/integrase [Elusimicrobiota bacterium]|nr:tyrosine-type recombinase/integrase [Elusimicrobiota bacterium]
MGWPKGVPRKPKIVAMSPSGQKLTGWGTPRVTGRGPSVVRYGSAEMREAKDRYMAWMISTGYAEDTLKGAHHDIEWLYRYLDESKVERLADVVPEMLMEYIVWLRETRGFGHPYKKLSSAHMYHRILGVRKFFQWAADHGLVLYDPAQDLEMPRVHSQLPQTIVTQQEARRILDAPDLTSPLGYRDKAVMELLYSGGLRKREMLKLKVADVDFVGHAVTIWQGKGRKDRIVPIPPSSLEYVKEYVQKIRPGFAKRRKADDGSLFLNWQGSSLTAYRLGELIQTYTKAAGVEKRVGTMTMRHSIASHLLENGMSIRYIQEFLGHEKLSTTQGYAKVTLTGLRRHYAKHHPRERRRRTALKRADAI